MIDLLATPLDRLVQHFETQYQKGRFHAEALYREIFKKGNREFLNAPEFQSSPKFSKILQNHCLISPGVVIETYYEQGLSKFITCLADGAKIESVIIPMTRYQTLCVSSQVGCKWGCRFCETGSLGFKRQLTASEIIGQVYNARHTLGRPIKNIVFMGMGEPLDNYDAVMTAIQVMNAQKGLDIALRHITVSTAGVIPGIQRLADSRMKGLRLAVSINAPDDATRSQLMPVNRRFPLADLKKSLLGFPLPRKGSFLFEYILIKGMNDSEAQARALADFIHPLSVRLNLIPFNPVNGCEFKSPSKQEMHEFAQRLSARGIFVIKRWTRGRSVSAGCGQLGHHTRTQVSLKSLKALP